jgi:hypothetical protein
MLIIPCVDAVRIVPLIRNNIIIQDISLRKKERKKRRNRN